MLVGQRAIVSFDDRQGLPRTTPISELVPVDAGPSPAKTMAKAPRKPRASKAATATKVKESGGKIEEQSRASNAPDTKASAELKPIDRLIDTRQAMEAIRLGVVPARCASEYTVGRDEALKSLGALEKQARGLRILWGNYGSGKTHMLDVIESSALERGIVTARVTLDPTEVPPSHPQRLFRAIANQIRLPDEAGLGLASLLEKLVASPEHRTYGGRRADRFFTPYLWARHRGDELASNLIHDYLTGEPTDRDEVHRALKRTHWRGERLLALSDFRTYGRLYTYMLGVLASWAKDAGYRGLMLLLDEVEYVDSLNRENLQMARDVIDHLAAGALPQSALTFQADALRRGGHEVHRNLPLHYEADQPLMVILAATPLEEVRTELAGRLRDPNLHIELRDLELEHLAILVTKVLCLYLEAHPDLKLTEANRQTLYPAIVKAAYTHEHSTRMMVRTVVALCDRLRFLGTV
jgi:hypothetical protein